VSTDAVSTDGGKQPSGHPTTDLSDLFNVPNTLSMARIVGAVVMSLVYVYVDRKIGMVIGVVAGFTDIFDGFIARKLNQITEIGAKLDRWSDVIFATSVFTVLIHFDLVPWWYFCIYAIRELVVLFARGYAGSRGGELPTSLLGKLKTDFFSLSFAAMFLGHCGLLDFWPWLANFSYPISFIGISIGLALSIAGGLIYTREAVRLFRHAKASEA